MYNRAEMGAGGSFPAPPTPADVGDWPADVYGDPVTFAADVELFSQMEEIEELLDFSEAEMGAVLDPTHYTAGNNSSSSSSTSCWNVVNTAVASSSPPAPAGCSTAVAAAADPMTAAFPAVPRDMQCEEDMDMEWLSNFLDADEYSYMPPSNMLLPSDDNNIILNTTIITTTTISNTNSNNEKNIKISASVDEDSTYCRTASPVSVLEIPLQRTGSEIIPLSSSSSSSSPASSSCSSGGKSTLIPLEPMVMAIPARARSKRPRPTKNFSPRAPIVIADVSSEESEHNCPPKYKKKKNKKIFSSSPDTDFASAGEEGGEEAEASAAAVVIRKCTHCEITKTPQWRAGPRGPKTLCNACGVRYKSGRLFPEYRPAASPTFVAAMHSNSHKKVVEMRNRVAGDGDGDQREAAPAVAPAAKACELLHYIRSRE